MCQRLRGVAFKETAEKVKERTSATGASAVIRGDRVGWPPAYRQQEGSRILWGCSSQRAKCKGISPPFSAFTLSVLRTTYHWYHDLELKANKPSNLHVINNHRPGCLATCYPRIPPRKVGGVEIRNPTRSASS